MRAVWLGTVEYIGWTPVAYAIASLWDLLHGIVYSLKGKRMPDSARYPRPQTPAPSTASSIADFNTEAFMRQLNK